MSDKPSVSQIGELKKIAAVITSEPIPSLFCDGFQGLAIQTGVVRINLTEDRYDTSAKEIKRYVIARLLMPLETAAAFSRALGTTVDAYNNDINKDGASKGHAVAAEFENINEQEQT